MLLLPAQPGWDAPGMVADILPVPVKPGCHLALAPGAAACAHHPRTIYSRAVGAIPGLAADVIGAGGHQARARGPGSSDSGGEAEAGDAARTPGFYFQLWGWSLVVTAGLAGSQWARLLACLTPSKPSPCTMPQFPHSTIGLIPE